MTTEEKEINTKTDEVNPPTREDTPPIEAGGDFGTIAGDLIASMPEVQEHAIQQEIDTESQKMAEYAHLVDVGGNSFDPDIHKTTKSGEPTLSPKGKLIKKAGRKPKPEQQQSRVGGAPVRSSDSPESQLRAQSRASGLVTANILMQVGIVAGGDEWRPMIDEASGLNERAMLEGAFSDYFEATGKTDLPPNLALLVAVGAYVVPRFTMPKTQTRVGKLKAGIKGWFVNRKLKKHGLTARPSSERAPDKKPPQSATLEA